MGGICDSFASLFCFTDDMNVFNSAEFLFQRVDGPNTKGYDNTIAFYFNLEVCIISDDNGVTLDFYKSVCYNFLDLDKRLSEFLY